MDFKIIAKVLYNREKSSMNLVNWLNVLVCQTISDQLIYLKWMQSNSLHIPHELWITHFSETIV